MCASSTRGPGSPRAAGEGRPAAAHLRWPGRGPRCTPGSCSRHSRKAPRRARGTPRPPPSTLAAPPPGEPRLPAAAPPSRAALPAGTRATGRKGVLNCGPPHPAPRPRAPPPPPPPHVPPPPPLATCTCVLMACLGLGTQNGGCYPVEAFRKRPSQVSLDTPKHLTQSR